MSYTSVSSCKDSLNILSTTFDTYISSLILIADDIIDSYCQQSLAFVTQIEYFYGDNSNFLQIKKNPVNSIVNLFEKSDFTSSYVTVDNATYELVELNGNYFVYKDSVFELAKFPKKYKIEFTSGYAAIPNDVKLAATNIVKKVFLESEKRGGSARFGISQIAGNNMGQSETTTYKDILPEVYDLLRPYRIWST